MKLRLSDPANHVSRLLHRATPGGELVILDLEGYHRGEVFCSGSGDGWSFIELRCQLNGRWDKVDLKHLVTVSWPTRANRHAFYHWDKGTLIALLVPLHKWMPSASKKWTCLKETL